MDRDDGRRGRVIELHARGGCMVCGSIWIQSWKDNAIWNGKGRRIVRNRHCTG